MPTSPARNGRNDGSRGQDGSERSNEGGNEGCDEGGDEEAGESNGDTGSATVSGEDCARSDASQIRAVRCGHRLICACIVSASYHCMWLQ